MKLKPVVGQKLLLHIIGAAPNKSIHYVTVENVGSKYFLVSRRIGKNKGYTQFYLRDWSAVNPRNKGCILYQSADDWLDAGKRRSLITFIRESMGSITADSIHLENLLTIASIIRNSKKP